MLDGVTLDADLEFVSEYGGLFLRNGLTLNGVISMGTDHKSITYLGTQLVDGSGRIETRQSLNSSASPIPIYFSAENENDLLVIGQGVTLSLHRPLIGYNAQGQTLGRIANLGRLEAIGEAVLINFDNFGQVELTPGETLTWSGVETLANSLASDVAHLDQAALRIGGPLDLQGGVLDSRDFFSLELSGEISNGVLEGDADNPILLGNSTLDGVTIKSVVQADDDAEVVVRNVLRLDSQILMVGAGEKRLRFEGSQTLDGAGQILSTQGDLNVVEAMGDGTFLRIEIDILIQIPQGGAPLRLGSDRTDVWERTDLRGTLQSLDADVEVTLGNIFFWPGVHEVDVPEGATLVYVWGHPFNATPFASADELAKLHVRFETHAEPFSGLVVTDTFASLAFRGGGVTNVTVIQGGPGRELLVTGGTLAGVTLTVDTRLTADLRVEDGLTLNATLTMVAGSGTTALQFFGSQTLGGNRKIVFEGSFPRNAIELLSHGDVLTIGPGMTIETAATGGGERIGPSFANGPGEVINHGVINLADPSQTNVLGSVDNQGTINMAPGGALELNGIYSTATFNSLNAGAVTIFLGGRLDNTGQTLDTTLVDQLIMVDAVVQGGAIAGAKQWLIQGGELQGVTLDADVRITSAAGVTVRDGLTVNGNLTLDILTDTAGSRLEFDGSQTLAGTGAIHYATAIDDPDKLFLGPVSGSHSTLTIGPDLTINLQSGTLGSTSNHTINHATLIANDPTRDIVFGALENLGQIQLAPGSTVQWRGPIATATSLNSNITNRDQASFIVTQAIANEGQTIDLGDFALLELGNLSRIQGGVIQGGAGETLEIRDNVLFQGGVTLNAQVNVDQVATLSVEDGLTLNGQITAGVDGTIDIRNDLTQTADGELIIVAKGPLANEYGQVLVNGVATLDGALEIQLVDGWEPAAGDAITPLAFVLRVGDFASVVGLDLPGGLVFDRVFGGAGMTLTAAMAPPTARALAVLADDGGDEDAAIVLTDVQDVGALLLPDRLR